MNLGSKFRAFLKVIIYLTFNVLTRGLSRHVNWPNVSTQISSRHVRFVAASQISNKNFSERVCANSTIQGVNN